MIILDHEQGTPEWFKARCGLPTASKFKEIITTKGEVSKSRTKYLYQLAGEKIIQTKEESFQSSAMARGVELEPEARMLFEMLHNVDVVQCGLCMHDSMKFGCSPDGLLPDSGIEIKCPSLAVHVEYLLGQKVPAEYYQQVQGSMLVVGRKTWWFMSYYPGMKPLILESKIDNIFTERLEKELLLFSEELTK